MASSNSTQWKLIFFFKCMLDYIGPDHLFASSFFYSKVKPIFCFNIQNQEAQWEDHHLVKASQNDRKMRIFGEDADELFSQNTQAGPKSLHKL